MTNPEVTIVCPLPPSKNAAYRCVGKAVKLSKIGRSYKTTFDRRVMAENKHVWTDLPEFDEDEALEVEIVLYLKAVYVKGWPKKAKHRFRRNDVDGRLLLLMDCLEAFLEINDTNFFRLSIEKHEDPYKPRAEVTIRALT